MHTRLQACLLCAMATATVFAQERPLTKEEERQKFHSVKVRGSDASVRQRAYEHRLRLMQESPFGALQWRNIGPEIQGGRVIDIEAPANDPSKLYVAFATGGLWRTTDDGINWTPLFDNQSAFGIGAIAIGPDGKTLWVGTGEANSQRTSYSGTGVFKSTDEGKTWQYLGLPESHHIGEVAVHPTNVNVAYVAALGHLYSANPERGVYKTSDGGRSWQHVLKVDDTTGAFDVAIDPKNPEVILASMWDRERTAWNFRESGKGSGVFRSENGGRTWTPVTSLPRGIAAGRMDLAWARSNPKVVYAVVDNQAEDDEWFFEDERQPSGRLTARRFLRLSDDTLPQVDERALADFLRGAGLQNASELAKQAREKQIGFAALKKAIEDRNPSFFTPPIVSQELYRSDDGGKTFKRVAKTDEADYQYYFARVFVNPKNENEVITSGLYLLRSLDGGKSWRRIALNSHVDYHAYWFDPRADGKTWIGNDGGLYLSGDGGLSVRHINNLPVGQPTTIAVDNKRPYNVYIGLQDNGTMKGPSNYVPGRSDLNLWRSIGGGDGSAVFVDPRNDGDLVYVASQFGAHSAIDQVTGERWSTRPQAPRGDKPARFNWISPLILSPHHPDIVYVGAQRLYRSFNQGRRFVPISPDLTKDKPNGDVPFSTIKDVSESPLRFGLIYVGADDGRMTVTHDGGFSWQDIPTPQPDKWISRVVASKYDEGTVYVAQNGYREDDFNAYLWKSTDYGKTWRSIVGNLPMEPINVVREDPNKRDVLYVGTDMGVYVSLDGGATWETLHGGMPNLPVHDLAIQARDNEIVAATHARSVYALQLRLVHDATPELRERDLRILDVPEVPRGSSGFGRSAEWGYENRQRWDSSEPAEPVARVTFWAKAPGKATIRIKKDGKVLKETTMDALRGYNFGTISLMLEPAKPFTPSKLDPVQKGEEALKDPYEQFRAKFLERGDYTLEVELNGKTETSTLRIVAPRAPTGGGRGGGFEG